MVKLDKRLSIVFLSSSFVNLAELLAKEQKGFDIFLVHDRKVPFENQNQENFYMFTFDKNKVYERSKEKYFDSLAVFINDFEPDVIICDNFTKLLPNSFIDFFKFINSKIKIINLHHADLRITENDKMKYDGINGMVKQFLDMGEFSTTIHYIEDSGMDTGTRLFHTKSTSSKELKNKSLISSRSDIINLRLRNVILLYHERTKVLGPLTKTLHQIKEL